MNVLTLESPVSLEFVKLLNEMVIALLPQYLDKLELEIIFPNLF